MGNFSCGSAADIQEHNSYQDVSASSRYSITPNAIGIVAIPGLAGQLST
jgi:hypothetical protein